MNLSKAIDGYLINATELSPRTLELYGMCLYRFANWLGDIELHDVNKEHTSKFLKWLQESYKPTRFSGDISPLSATAIDKYWIALRSFFSWSADTLNIERPDLQMKRPKVTKPEIIPYSKEEVDKIIYQCTWITTSGSDKRKSYRMKKPKSLRDRAIIFTLLDTGIRLGELLRLEYRDLNMDNGELHIRAHNTGIKSKPRTVFLSRSTKKELWLYLSEHENYPNDKIFDIKESSFQSLMFRLQERTGTHVHAHRFRHTFAIQYLRNGGDIFTLQRLLGHATLEMVRYYLHLADADTQDVHRRSSPVDRWHL